MQAAAAVLPPLPHLVLPPRPALILLLRILLFGVDPASTVVPTRLTNIAIVKRYRFNILLFVFLFSKI